jgi:hypothetical protein
MINIQMKKVGELKIKLERLKRGTTKPLIRDIEILYPNKLKTDKRYIGIVDTGADITRIDSKLLRLLNLEELEKNFFKLEIKIKDLFNDRILTFEIQPYDITHNNQIDNKPDILLGRDFLALCKMQYDGLNNTVILEAFTCD